MPLWIFVLLALLPVVVLAVWGGKKVFDKRRTQQAPQATRKKAFARARALLQAAEKRQAYAQIYPIFIGLFKARCGIEEAELSDDALVELLKKAGLDDKSIQQWNSFFAQCAELIFGDRTQQEYDELFEQAYSWLDRLEKSL